MADLIVIGYPDEATAALAADEARVLVKKLGIQAYAFASIARDKAGRPYLNTVSEAGRPGFWGLLFGVVFFDPLLGLAIGHEGRATASTGEPWFDQEFSDQVPGLLKPGTSVLFLIMDGGLLDRVIGQLRKYGGTVLRASPTRIGEAQLQEALYSGGGVSSAAPPGPPFTPRPRPKPPSYPPPRPDEEAD